MVEKLKASSLSALLHDVCPEAFAISTGRRPISFKYCTVGTYGRGYARNVGGEGVGGEGVCDVGVGGEGVCDAYLGHSSPVVAFMQL